MLIPVFTNKYKKDLEKSKKQGRDIEELKKVIELLINGKSLPQKYKDHKLSGNYKDCRECHIKSDWLLIYTITDKELILERISTHSELFK